MMRGQAKGRKRKGDQDDVTMRQPAWRQAPAQPRKRAKRVTFTLQRDPKKKGLQSRVPVPAVVMPSREVVANWLRAALLLLVAAGVALGLLYLLRWPVLAVSPASTQIGGAQRIAKEIIYEQSKVDGRNILVIETREVMSRVRHIPGIAGAAVHLRLPNQVIIDVVEHAPLVAWQGITTTLWLAADGSQVPQAGVVPPLRLIDVSEGLLDKDATLRSMVLENLAALHALRPELSEFYYGQAQGLYYRATQGWDVWLGETGPLDAKLALVDAAARDLMQQGRQVEVIDVRRNDREAMWR